MNRLSLFILLTIPFQVILLDIFSRIYPWLALFIVFNVFVLIFLEIAFVIGTFIVESLFKVIRLPDRIVSTKPYKLFAWISSILYIIFFGGMFFD